MAYYAYKVVRDLIPKWVTDSQGPDYEGEPNYDGDLWYATAAYIEFLETLCERNSIKLDPTEKDIERAKAI